LTYAGGDFIEKKFDVAPTPYRLIIENVGKDVNGNIVIGFVEA